MDNIIARQKEKAKNLVELFFYPWVESSIEYAKKCAIQFCEKCIDLDINTKSYWEGVKSEIEKFEINNTLIYRNQKYMIRLLKEATENIREIQKKQ